MSRNDQGGSGPQNNNGQNNNGRWGQTNPQGNGQGNWQSEQQHGERGSWNSSSRMNHQDERIMRRGDDRTVDSRDYGQSYGQSTPERNAYRNDDYPTDKQIPYRAGQDHIRGDRDMAYGDYGNRNNQTHGQTNFTQNTGTAQTSSPDRGYGWSSNDRSTNDYRPETNTSGWMNNENQTFDRSNNDRGFSGTNYGWNSTLNEGSSSRGSFAAPGPHSGKGPKGYRRSDDRIKEEVSDVLERNPHIDASEIELDVKDGVVTLRGHVDERRSKRLAEDVIEHLQGVRDVRNELVVDQTLFQQAKSLLFGDSAESLSASSTNANRSTATKSKH